MNIYVEDRYNHSLHVWLKLMNNYAEECMIVYKCEKTTLALGQGIVMSAKVDGHVWHKH